MNELALFSGAGGGILGGKLLGWRTVCAVELDPYARSDLLARQRDGCLDPFPIWDDVRTFDGQPWRGAVNVVSGGFPCQDISCAGKGAGITGVRSGLWREMARIVGEVRPEYVFVENSPALVGRGLGTVLGDLAQMGFDAEWGVLSAAESGAPHRRDRIWIVAHTQLPERRPLGGACDRLEGPHGISQREEGAGRARISGENLADAYRAGCEKQRCALADAQEHSAAQCGSWWRTEPGVGRVAHGMAHRVDRLQALGNGQVPAVAARAFSLLANNLRTKNL